MIIIYQTTKATLLKVITSLLLILYFSGDSSEYRINGVHVTLAKYLEELEKIGIVTKARNCLVFQVNANRYSISTHTVYGTCLEISTAKHENMLKSVSLKIFVYARESGNGL